MSEQKKILRSQALKHRSKMTVDPQAAEDICESFFERFAAQIKGKTVALYWPKGKEVDTSPFMQALVGKGAVMAMPVVQEGSRLLKFVSWNEKTPMKEGFKGIFEPVIDGNTVYVEPDIFIVPLLAFDRKGARLGYGGGYYDTTLAHYRKRKSGVLAVGIAYAEQITLFPLPREAHDQLLDMIITQQDRFDFRD